MKRMQAGFTLIELVIVIVILGILAATALPRFVDLSSDARKAKLSAAVASVKSASNLVHASALAKGLGSGLTSITAEGETINIFGKYPTANTQGIDTAAGLGGADYTVDTTAGADDATGIVTVQVDGGSDPTNCSFTYSASDGTNPPDISDPVTAGTDGGC